MEPLSKMLEAEALIRQLAREQRALTVWKEGNTGVPSVQHMSMNVVVLEVVARWWLPQTQGPMPIPIDNIRKEAQSTKLFFVGWGVFVFNFVDGLGRLRLVASCFVVTVTDPNLAQPLRFGATCRSGASRRLGDQKVVLPWSSSLAEWGKTSKGCFINCFSTFFPFA